MQESAPERLELKRELLAAADRAAPAGAVICSSTSGLRPTDLQAGLARPERLVVGHPFNPVYLLPLVEVCGGRQTDAATVERAAAVYRSVGMHPLHVRTEIDGFVADRLLEALWREALWLVHDDVATVAEIDDAIRYGAGLRWAYMGTFLTYRIAGGDAGMRHFLSQFGPALAWPWTKLMDVPELSDDLIDKLAAQSDDQAEGRSVRELERGRDDALVALLQGLRARRTGAGETLAVWEHGLLDQAAGAAAPDEARPVRSGCTQRTFRRTGSTTTATSTRAVICRSSATRRTRSSPRSGSTRTIWPPAGATSPSRRTSRTFGNSWREMPSP